MRKLLLLLIMTVILFSTIEFGGAQRLDDNIASDVNVVQVAVYVLNLGKFDVATGTFTVDFYLDMKCSQSCENMNFEFMNGRAASTDLIIDEEKEKFYRIQANLNSPVDLKKFPFDEQRMQIIIEDKIHTTDELVYMANMEESGIDKSIAFTGWEIKDWSAEISEHEYEIYDEVYSQYVFTIPIKKIFFSSIIKSFLPVVFIVLVMLSSFVLDPDKITTRLGMVGSALVASVMFHVSLSNQIPSVGYLTFADKFMILTYFVMLLSFAMNVTLLELQERKKMEIVERVHRRTEFLMFVLVPILYAILFIFFL